jgi:hypothetical protein
MRHQIDFDPLVSNEERPGIGAGLRPLATAGFEILVAPPDMVPELGWCIRVSTPGHLRNFRTTAATPAEWAAFVATVLRVSDRRAAKR